MIVFNGVDIVLKKNITNDNLKTALANSIMVKESEVKILDNIEEIISSSADLNCLKQTVFGDFKLLLSLYCKNIKLDYLNESELYMEISKKFGFECLFPTEDINPYRMFLAGPTGFLKTISLSPEALERNYYLVSS